LTRSLLEELKYNKAWPVDLRERGGEEERRRGGEEIII
jgi:hypothetical protein